MIDLFAKGWQDVPTVWIDTETTGLRPGYDRAVSLGVARFEGGKAVRFFSVVVNPGIPIPEESRAVHGISDLVVLGAPTIEEVCGDPEFRSLVSGAQPAAYNAPFDRHFVTPFGEDWMWPWLDGLSLVRVVDRYERGKGRHKLEAACSRHGVTLDNAHNAGADAKAAGELFYKLAPQVLANRTLGSVLHWQKQREAEEWFRFAEWRSKQPPMEASV